MLLLLDEKFWHRLVVVEKQAVYVFVTGGESFLGGFPGRCLGEV
jgi:hypothetical protein